MDSREFEDGVSSTASRQIGRNKQVGLPRVMALYLPHNADDPIEQLASSLVDDVMIGLGRIRTLSIVAPYTAKRIVAESTIDSFVGLNEHFGVDYVVDSKITRRDGVYFLLTRLIEVASQEIVWSEKQKFDRILSEQQYRELSIRIIQSIVLVIETTALDRYENVHQDPDAYFWYLTGKKDYDHLDIATLRKARKAFANALKGAPHFTPALSGVARTMQLEWLVTARSEKDALVEAEVIAKRAARSDPSDERPLRELGIISMYLGKFDDSLEFFQRGELINAQHADLLADYADALNHYGKVEEAVATIEHALVLNPMAPDYYYWVGAGALHHMGRNAEAVELLEKMVNPRAAARLAAVCWAVLGEPEKATEWKDKALVDNPDFQVDEWIKTMSLRTKEQRERYASGMRLAGFR